LSNYYLISERKQTIIVSDIKTNNSSISFITLQIFPKPLRISRSQFRSAERAESKVCLNRALADTAEQGFFHGCRERVIVGEEVLTIGAMVERILGWPLPHGNKEELENLVGVHKVNAVAAVCAFAHSGFQYLSYLLL